MTRFSDNIYTGNQAVTSALSSRSPALFCKTHRFTQPATGGATVQTQTGTFPVGTQNLDAKLFIMANGSATVSDKITVSAGGANLVQMTAFGSASGVLRVTTAALGVLTNFASAAAVLTGAASSELSYSVTFLPVSASQSTSYQLQLNFSRVDSNTLGITA